MEKGPDPSVVDHPYGEFTRVEGLTQGLTFNPHQGAMEIMCSKLGGIIQQTKGKCRINDTP